MAASVGSSASETKRADPAVSASGTGLSPSDARCAALTEGLRVRQRLGHGGQGGARDRQQLVTHAQKMFAHDVQARGGQQMVNVCHAPGNGVFDRDHGVADIATFHRRQCVLERGAGHHLAFREHLTASEVRVGAGFALIGDA